MISIDTRVTKVVMFTFMVLVSITMVTSGPVAMVPNVSFNGNYQSNSILKIANAEESDSSDNNDDNNSDDDSKDNNDDNNSDDDSKDNNSDDDSKDNDNDDNNSDDDSKDNNSDFKDDKKLKCVIGDRESEKNGNLELFKETKKYCGDHWYLKTANKKVLMIGFNTFGDIDLQSDWGQSLVDNSKLMKGIKTILLFGHKAAHTPPGTEHQVENAIVQMYSEIKSKVSKGVGLYEIAAHDHLMAESENGHWFISGAGSDQESSGGETNSKWTFVDSEEGGYLKIKINDHNGKISSSHFYDLDGKLIQ